MMSCAAHRLPEDDDESSSFLLSGYSTAETVSPSLGSLETIFYIDFSITKDFDPFVLEAPHLQIETDLAHAGLNSNHVEF